MIKRILLISTAVLWLPACVSSSTTSGSIVEQNQGESLVLDPRPMIVGSTVYENVQLTRRIVFDGKSARHMIAPFYNVDIFESKTSIGKEETADGECLFIGDDSQGYSLIKPTDFIVGLTIECGETKAVTKACFGEECTSILMQTISLQAKGIRPFTVNYIVDKCRGVVVIDKDYLHVKISDFTFVLQSDVGLLADADCKQK